MPGYDKSRFVNLTKNESQQLVCGICLSILNNPKFTKCCEQAYCLECIEQWLTNSKTCPNDRKQLTKGNLRNVPKFVKNMLLAMELYCQYKEFGCREILNLEVIENHEANCKFNPKVVCPICLSQNGELSKHECITNLIIKYQKSEQLNEELKKEFYVINANYQNEIDFQRNQIDILKQDVARSKEHDHEIVVQRNQIEVLERNLTESKENEKVLECHIDYLVNESEQMSEKIIKLKDISQKSNDTIKILKQMLISVQKTFSAFHNEVIDNEKILQNLSVNTDCEVLLPSSSNNGQNIIENELRNSIEKNCKTGEKGRNDNMIDIGSKSISVSEYPYLTGLSKETKSEYLDPSKITDEKNIENKLTNTIKKNCKPAEKGIDDNMIDIGSKSISVSEYPYLTGLSKETKSEYLVPSNITNGTNIIEKELQISNDESCEEDQNSQDGNRLWLSSFLISQGTYTQNVLEFLNKMKKPKTRKKRIILTQTNYKYSHISKIYKP